MNSGLLRTSDLDASPSYCYFSSFFFDFDGGYPVTGVTWGHDRLQTRPLYRSNSELLRTSDLDASPSYCYRITSTYIWMVHNATMINNDALHF